MNKLILVFTLLCWSRYSSLAQDNTSMNPVYYFVQDSVSLKSIFCLNETNCDSSELLGYFTRFIIDKHGENITGWVLAKRKNYLLARQVIDGKQSGFEIQYLKIKNQYILSSIVVFSKDQLETQLLNIEFDSKKVKNESNINGLIKKYKIFNLNKSNPNLVSTEVKILSNTKQQVIDCLFYKEACMKLKSKSKSARNDKLLLCQLEQYSISKVPKIIALNNLTNVFKRLWQ